MSQVTETVVATEKAPRIRRPKPTVSVGVIYFDKDEARNNPPKIQGFDETPDFDEQGNPTILKTPNDAKNTVAENYKLFRIRVDGENLFTWAVTREMAESFYLRSIQPDIKSGLADSNRKGRSAVLDPDILKMLDYLKASNPAMLPVFVLADKKNHRYGPLYGVAIPVTD